MKSIIRNAIVGATTLFALACGETSSSESAAASRPQALEVFVAGADGAAALTELAGPAELTADFVAALPELLPEAGAEEQASLVVTVRGAGLSTRRFALDPAAFGPDVAPEQVIDQLATHAADFDLVEDSAASLPGLETAESALGRCYMSYTEGSTRWCLYDVRYGRSGVVCSYTTCGGAGAN